MAKRSCATHLVHDVLPVRALLDERVPNLTNISSTISHDATARRGSGARGSDGGDGEHDCPSLTTAVLADGSASSRRLSCDAANTRTCTMKQHIAHSDADTRATTAKACAAHHDAAALAPEVLEVPKLVPPRHPRS
jgi:hypothetical protein